jgi:hypothetical protein
VDWQNAQLRHLLHWMHKSLWILERNCGCLNGTHKILISKEPPLSQPKSVFITPWFSRPLSSYSFSIKLTQDLLRKENGISWRDSSQIRRSLLFMPLNGLCNSLW